MLRARFRGVAAALALVVTCAADGRAQEGARWEQLGSKAVDFRAERDVITVTAREGRFDAIKLHVSGNAIEVLDVKVRFGSGESQDVQVRQQIREGGETRVIDLERDDRVIQAIELVYRTQGRAREGRAEVKIFGRHSQRAAAEDWVRLGEREVAFRGERDTIAVTGVEGRFSKVMLEVKLNGIEVLDLKLHFGDGTQQDVEVRERIPAGGRTRAIDLSGGPRVINRVEMVYKTEDRRDGRATVVLWGLRVAGAAAEPGRGGGDAGEGLVREGWKALGQREVTFRVERDTIEVGRDAGRFSKLRFVVRGNAVELLDVKLTYGNGQTQDVQVRERLGEGAATRVIDLGGEERFIKSVEFVYRTDGPNREGRATIRLFGR